MYSKSSKVHEICLIMEYLSDMPGIKQGTGQGGGVIRGGYQGGGGGIRGGIRGGGYQGGGGLY